jgi:hypothetical protein
MRPTMTLNTASFRSKVRSMASASPQARKDAVKIMADEVVREVLRKAPRDTCRFVRGWAQALNASGAGTVPVPALKRSPFHDDRLRILQKQLRFWDYVVQRDTHNKRNDKWTRRALQKRDRAREMIERFAEGGETPILINLFGSAKFEGGLATVRHKLYGGTGRIIDLGGHAVVVLTNLEAHATLVEHNHKTFANATARFKSVGLRRVAERYVKRVAAGQGLAA